MAEWGGYRRPTTPAQVSGPGKFSQRTDGKPTVEDPKQAARYISGMPYGEGAELNSLAGSAPLSAAQGMPSVSSVPPIDIAQLTPLDAPTERPNESVDTFNQPVEDTTSTEYDAVASFIRNAYTAYPSPYLRLMLERLRKEGR
jgi:hypothetical protein